MRAQNIFVFILLLITINAYSQIEQSLRVEIENKSGFTDYNVYPFGNNGVLVYCESVKSDGKENIIKFIKYDLEFKEKTTKQIRISKKLHLDEEFKTDNYLYLFFHSHKKGNYIIVTYNITNNTIQQVSGIIPAKTYVLSIRAINNHAYLSCKHKKESYITVIDLTSQKTKFVNMQPNSMSKKYSIDNIQVLQEAKEVHIGVRDHIKSTQNYYILKLNEEGEKIDNFIQINENDEYHIKNSSTSKLSDDSHLITGTYSKLGHFSAQGLFITRINDNKRKFIKYYNFLDFDNFLSYLPERKQEKIKKKKAKKEARGKELSFNYNLVMHDIIEMNGEYILIAEAYYPTYRTEMYTTTDSQGRTVTRTRTVFDGYQYSHAVVTGFDINGEKLWDNTFKMWVSDKPYYAKKFITVSTNEDVVNLLFISGYKIKSMSLTNGKVTNEREITYTKTENENDKIKSSNKNNIDHWYENYFISWGYQKIKNKEDKSIVKKRKVFFFNKISYR